MAPSTLQSISSNLPLTMIPGIKGAAITSFQVLATMTSYFAEANPNTTAQYSKFANNANKSSKDALMIPSRLGMTLIYAPAFMVSTVMMMYSHSISSSFPLATVFLLIHFSKRLLETYTIHSYSDNVGLFLSLGIGLYYAMITFLISSVAKGGAPVAVLLSEQSVEITMMGSLLFVIGSLGNLYHHMLLSSLRRTSNKSLTTTTTTKRKTNISPVYVPPKGGWFQYVAAPHYFFELLAWLGIAMVAQHLNAYLVFTSMCSYLAGRSVSQNRWNRHQFGHIEWPKHRKNLVPFIF